MSALACRSAAAIAVMNVVLCCQQTKSLDACMLSMERNAQVGLAGWRGAGLDVHWWVTWSTVLLGAPAKALTGWAVSARVALVPMRKAGPPKRRAAAMSR